jgi:hypothetical protein
MNSTIQSRICQFVGSHESVRLSLRLSGEPIHHGFVLAMSGSLVLLREMHDFYLEGCTAIQVSDIVSLHSGAKERYWDRIYQAEGLMDGVDLSFDAKLADFQSLLGSLQQHGVNVIVQSRSTEEDDEFHIGRVLALDSTMASILEFDSLGIWEDEPTNISYDAMTVVEFDSPYINIISRHLSDRPSKDEIDAVSEDSGDDGVSCQR